MGCSPAKVKYQHCSKVIEEWKCDVPAQFDDMESCKHYQILAQSYINFNELRDKGQTTITHKSSDPEVQTNCIE